MLGARTNRYRNLTWGLLGVLLIPPFTRDLFPGGGILGPLIFVIFVSRSLISTSASRLLRVVLATTMAAVAVRAVGGSAHFLRGYPPLEITLHLLATLGFSFVVIELFKQVLASGPVDTEKLYAAVSAYLVIALAFASVYEAITVWNPAAFDGAHARDGDALVYFSLVTLGTVGYGDITPALPQTRVLAVAEAISGQFYLAILIARLVGLHLNQSNSQFELSTNEKAARTQDDRSSASEVP